MVKKKLKLKFQEKHNKMEQFANTSECSFLNNVVTINTIYKLFLIMPKKVSNMTTSKLSVKIG